MQASPLTLGECIERLLPRGLDARRPPTWPPDLFAIAVSLLKRSGAYTAVVCAWPPRGKRQKWAEEMRRVGRDWRKGWEPRGGLPRQVLGAWAVLAKARATPLTEIANKQRIVAALMLLLAASDEASYGFGLPYDNVDGAWFRALELLLADKDRSASLGDEIDASRVVILPKSRTPRSGITVRSLSHNLAVIETSEVVCRWNTLPVESLSHSESLSLLLVPWPEVLVPDDFAERPSGLHDMPPQFGFFGCDERRGRALDFKRCRRLFEKALKLAGRVDGIVFPELSLLPGEAAKLARMTGRFVIGGVGDPKAVEGRNGVEFALPLEERSDAPLFEWKQGKHHRWRLGPSQVVQYALASKLDPARDWWEHFPIRDRSLGFWTPTGWLNMAVLICEDLARPDPVADIVRAVGPNLVISLLMDGPQLKERWPARYASVLADDPGSSVLTLTSLGMASLSRMGSEPPSRVIALWREDEAPIREVALSREASALVVTLRTKWREEWTADGRSDERTSSQLTWAGSVEIVER